MIWPWWRVYGKGTMFLGVMLMISHFSGWNSIIQVFSPGGGGHSTLGYAPCATKNTLLFFACFHRKTPIFTNFHPWPPIFNKRLVTERPWHIFVTQRPLIFAFNSQTSDDFLQKIRFFENFDKFDKYVEKFFAILALKAPIFDAFHWKTPSFCALCHWKTLFWRNCHQKTPTFEVLGGTRTSLSYVSAPPVFSHLVRVPRSCWSSLASPSPLSGRSWYRHSSVAY